MSPGMKVAAFFSGVLIAIVIYHYFVLWLKRNNRRIVFTGINTWDSPSRCCWSTQPFIGKEGDTNPSLEYRSHKTKFKEIYLVYGQGWARVMEKTPAMEHWLNPKVTIHQIFILGESHFKDAPVNAIEISQYCNKPMTDLNYKIQTR